MRSARRRTLVSIEKATETRDPTSNEKIKTWAEWKKCFVSISARRGNEFFEANQRYAETVYRMTGDHFDLNGITPQMRVVFEGNEYDIKTVMPDPDYSRDIIVDLTLRN